MSEDYEEDEEQAKSSRSGSGCLQILGYFMLMLTGGIILLALVAMLGVWYAGERFMGAVDSVLYAPTATPTIDIRSVVVRQVRDASELTTSIFAMETVADASVSREILGLEVGTTRLLYIGYGEVRAGIDLSEINTEDVEVTTDTIRLRLPPPRILDSKIDVNRSRIYDYDQGFFAPEAPDLQSLAEQDALSKIIAGACENGILQEANKKAELAMTQLLSVTGYDNIVVEIQAPAAGECPVP
jgi:hypothetical protein